MLRNMPPVALFPRQFDRRITALAGAPDIPFFDPVVLPAGRTPDKIKPTGTGPDVPADNDCQDNASRSRMQYISTGFSST